jgi:hypothetical protein
MKSKQEFFDVLVVGYNNDYMELLGRAAAGETRELIEPFLRLRDLYEAILRLHDIGDVVQRIRILPLTSRGNTGLLTQLGFGPDEIAAIRRFYDILRTAIGSNIEETISS